MKISEAIEKLKQFQAEVGDVPLVDISQDESDIIVAFKELEISYIPNEAGDGEECVIAFINPDEFDVHPDDDPRNKRNTLKLVE